MGYADLEKTERGYLVDTGDWTPAIAEEIAATESLTLTEKHWDLINYLREEFFDNNENQPNERHMCKAMGERWGGSVATKDLYDLFPMQPSKQAGKIAGLPETKRKGGY